MCTVWAALFLFLSLSVSVPAFPSFSPSLAFPFAIPLFIHLSFSYHLLTSSLFFLSSQGSSLFPTRYLRPSFSRPSRPSCYLFVFRALSIFLPLLFHRPSIFPLLFLARPLSFFCSPSSANSSLPPPPPSLLPLLPLSILLLPLSLHTPAPAPPP